MKTLCPACGQVLNMPDRLAGKTVACPACKRSFVSPMIVSGPGQPAVPPPALRPDAKGDRAAIAACNGGINALTSAKE
jgi:hypothetical protein